MKTKLNKLKKLYLADEPIMFQRPCVFETKIITLDQFIGNFNNSIIQYSQDFRLIRTITTSGYEN